MRTQTALHLPFALLLPGLQLLVALLVITPELMVGMELQHRPHSVTLDGKVVPGNLNINQLVEIATHLPKRTFPDRLHAMSILNMPGMLGEIVISLPTTWPESWFPKSTYFADVWIWRAFSWAMYTLPLWWMAGRALDALKGRTGTFRPQILGLETSIMMLIGLLTLIIGLGLFFAGNGREDDGAINRWVLLPGLMWFGFGLCSLVAWCRQRWTRRALAVGKV